jgi:hypothetical protein
MAEDVFVEEALEAASGVLKPPLAIKRGAALLYQVTVNNRLELTVNPKKPSRGTSAFQTDLAVFENMGAVEIPRVVMEFKAAVSTHDVITYSAKARKHKQVYPYLRYGLVVGNEEYIPGRVFRHNEALDFCVAAAAFRSGRLKELFGLLLKREVKTSRLLESIAFESRRPRVFRLELVLEEKTP